MIHPFFYSNSWDRDPYTFDAPDTGALTTVKAMDNIRQVKSARSAERLSLLL